MIISELLLRVRGGGPELVAVMVTDQRRRRGRGTGEHTMRLRGSRRAERQKDVDSAHHRALFEVTARGDGSVLFFVRRLEGGLRQVVPVVKICSCLGQSYESIDVGYEKKRNAREMCGKKKKKKKFIIMRFFAPVLPGSPAAASRPWIQLREKK